MSAEKKELPWIKAQMEEHGCQDVLKGHSKYPFQEGLILGRFILESDAHRLAALDERVKLAEKAAEMLRDHECTGASDKPSCETCYEALDILLRRFMKK